MSTNSDTIVEEVKSDLTQLDILGLEEGNMTTAPPKVDMRESRRGGYYWLDNEPYPQVTGILGILDKPALRYWFGRQVYMAVVANPTLSEKEALAAPYKVTEKAQDRGSTIHSIVEAYKHTQEYIDNVPPEFKGYAQAFYKWTADNHITIQEHERTVVSRKYVYAGTLDLLVTLNGNTEPIVVDVKTGKDIYPEAFLQLSAYRQALKEEGTQTGGVAVLLLQEDGSYKYQFTQCDYFRQFFACKVIWDWQNAEDVQKMKEYAKKGAK